MRGFVRATSPAESARQAEWIQRLLSIEAAVVPLYALERIAPCTRAPDGLALDVPVCEIGLSARVFASSGDA